MNQFKMKNYFKIITKIQATQNENVSNYGKKDSLVIQRFCFKENCLYKNL